MWILLNNSFISIVKYIGKKDTLMVRARVKGDIEHLFPEAKVLEGAGSDYRYRAAISTFEVMEAIAKEIKNINYDNFKDSVPDEWRHNAYFEVWAILSKRFHHY